MRQLHAIPREVLGARRIGPSVTVRSRADWLGLYEDVQRVARFYPEIGDVIERARFWAGTLELQWLLGGLRSGDASWFTVHIGQARDVMPVGSGWKW